MQGNQLGSKSVICFGSFEADLHTHELRKHGSLLRLPGQSFQVLKMLLERRGELVTREEFRAALWPTDTFVDFDHGLHAAVSRLREVLGDSAESPHLIETLPRRGYRFIGTVEGLEEVEPNRNAGTTEIASFQPRSRRLRYSAIGISLILLLLAVWIGFYSRKSPAPVTSPSEYTQITNFSDAAMAPSFSPDGRMVTFKRGEDAFSGPGQIYVKLLPNGEPLRLTNDSDVKYSPVFTPDGSRIAYTDIGASGWDTWTVPVFGGQPTRFLPNASGLTWITDKRVLFSEIKTGLHMGIVASTENRADRREVYFPTNERAMAHFSYASPDTKSVLVVEMDQTHAIHQPCRLVPFDGSSAGKQVGPQGTCTAAAWSPDGKWMYFGVVVGVNAHLWRQRFPDGVPEQITFGPNGEEDIAVAPDGRSLVTSIGTRRSTVWIHDATGERAISSEGYASGPRLCRDSTHVYYLVARELALNGDVGWMASSSELRYLELGSGRSESVLPGISVTDYDISHDETEVAFTAKNGQGESQIWLSSLDRRTPPRMIVRAGDQVSFDADGDLVFRSLEETTNWLVRIKKDGTQRERVTNVAVLEKRGISPDGKWLIVGSSDPNEGYLLAVPLHGGTAKRICNTCSTAGWSSDGKIFYAESAQSAQSGRSPERTLAIPVPAGKSLPDLPVDPSAGLAAVRGSRMIEHVSVSSGADPAIYLFTKRVLQRNLFRIPLH
jgi:DNA-binding winged helix-turn-helix (wHTH) protein